AVAVLSRDHLAEVVGLEPLPAVETAQLAASLLEGPPSSAFGRWLYDITLGNPLFIEYVVEALREDRRLTRTDGLWHTADEAEVVVPWVLHELISQRVARLGGTS